MKVVEATHTHIRSEVKRIARIMVSEELTLDEACFEESFDKCSMNYDELNYIFGYIKRNETVRGM